MKTEFIHPRFVGSRFDEHTIPLDVARDLAVYEDLVVELAKRLFLQEHPERQRVPKGFGSDFQLHLEQVDEGSARPLISLVIAGTLMPVTAHQPYFEKARDLVNQCIAAPENQLPEEFPKDLLAYFNRFGRSLRDGESLEMDDAETPAVLTPAKRKALVLAADLVYERDLELSGTIEEADFKAMTFRMRLGDGGKATIPIPEHFADQARALNGRKRHLVTMKGVGTYDAWDKLQKVVEVESLSVQKNYEIANKLEEISELEDGWFEGGGSAPDSSRLDRVSSFLIDLYPEKLALPAIVPTPEGNLLLEWNTPGNPSLDIRLETMVGEYHSFDTEGRDVEDDFQLDTEDGWKSLFEFLHNKITPNPE